MQIKIVEVDPQSFHIVDTGVPGGRTLARHSNRSTAERAAARWGYKPLTVQPPTDPPPMSPMPVSEPVDVEALTAYLQRSAWTVLAEVKGETNTAELHAMERLEAEGRGRSTVIRAIKERLADLGEG